MVQRLLDPIWGLNPHSTNWMRFWTIYYFLFILSSFVHPPFIYSVLWWQTAHTRMRRRILRRLIRAYAVCLCSVMGSLTLFLHVRTIKKPPVGQHSYYGPTAFIGMRVVQKVLVFNYTWIRYLWQWKVYVLLKPKHGQILTFVFPIMSEWY